MGDMQHSKPKCASETQLKGVTVLKGLGTDDQQIKRHLVTSWRIKGAQNGVVLHDTTAQRLGGRRWTFCGFTLIVLSAT
jgi:hypothetical protein